jgi:hypothetical protein
VVIVAGAGAAGVGFRSQVAGIIAFALLLGSVSDYLFPVRYRLNREGVEARGLLFLRRMKWSEVRQVRREAMGVKLSSLARPSRLEAYRGIYLWFEGNEPEVMAAIAHQREAEAAGGSDRRSV